MSKLKFKVAYIADMKKNNKRRTFPYIQLSRPTRSRTVTVCTVAYSRPRTFASSGPVRREK